MNIYSLNVCRQSLTNSETPVMTSKKINLLLNPSMFNDDLSVTDTREREWTIKMAPPGRGSKVKNMQFKVQSKPSYVNPKCSKHCKMNFRIQFSGKTPSGEHFRRSEVIERELPKVFVVRKLIIS